MADPLSGTVAVSNGSPNVTFSQSQSLSAGAAIQFGAQSGVTYFLASAVSGTAGTLTANYSGTSSGASTAQLVEQSSFVHGGVTYPLPASGTSALKDADPAIYYLLGYAQAVLQTYIGPRIAAEAAAKGLNTGPNAITSAVGLPLPYDPEPVLLEQLAAARWPMLAIWRTSGKYRWRTVARMETIATLRVAYILPPLTSAQRERLLPLLNSVPKVLLERIENKVDPSFLGGANWMSAAYAGIDALDIVEDGWGRYAVQTDGGTNLIFPCWMGTLQLTERTGNMPIVATGGPFTGVDFDIDVVDGSGSAPLDIVDAQANFPNPLNIASLRALYRADQGVTTDTTGVFCTTLADQSPNGDNLTPPLAANAPYVLSDPLTTTPRTFAPKQVLRFDGVETYLTAADATLGNDTGKTLVVLFRLWDIVDRSSLLLLTDSGATTAHTASIEANVPSTGGGKLGFYAAGSSFDTQFPTDTLWHTAIVSWSSSSNGTGITPTFTLDGVPAVLTKVSGTGNWAGLGSSTTISVGALSSVATSFARASIGLAMVFNGALASTDAATCLSFCQQWLAGQV